LQSIYVSDTNFENDFSTKQFKNTPRNHKIVKYIFSKIEHYKYHNEINSDSDLYSIEHILPESSDESWGLFSNEEIDRSIYRLGNLTLLEKKLNRDASILSYSEKKDFFQKSNCNLTKNLHDEFESWTEAKITARQKDLAKAAKSIWKIQELN